MCTPCCSAVHVVPRGGARLTAGHRAGTKAVHTLMNLTLCAERQLQHADRRRSRRDACVPAKQAAQLCAFAAAASIISKNTCPSRVERSSLAPQQDLPLS